MLVSMKFLSIFCMQDYLNSIDYILLDIDGVILDQDFDNKFWQNFVPNEYAIKNKYDLYLLMDVDIPWVKDDLRDKPNERKEIFEYFKKTLQKYDKTYYLINGSFFERKLKSIEIIDKIINIVT